MKKVIVILLAISMFACTENQRARTFGGSETIELPKGERLVNASWKQDNLWYLTESMPADYVPQTKIYREKSNFGALNGTITFIESK